MHEIGRAESSLYGCVRLGRFIPGLLDTSELGTIHGVFYGNPKFSAVLPLDFAQIDELSGIDFDERSKRELIRIGKPIQFDVAPAPGALQRPFEATFRQAPQGDFAFLSHVIPF